VDDSAFVHSGIYGAFLGQNASPGNLSQTLPTAEGQRYLLSFWLANPLSGTPNEFHVSWEGQPLLDQVDVEQFAWTNIQYVVTASTSNSVLEFSFRHDQNAFGLDDVTVQALPSLRLEQVLHAQDGISLTWSSSAGARYQLQSATDLTAGNWIDWGDPVTATNGTLTVPQPITADPHRFYRLVLLP
jgi:hypothetical protein